MGNTCSFNPSNRITEPPWKTALPMFRLLAQKIGFRGICPREEPGFVKSIYFGSNKTFAPGSISSLAAALPSLTAISIKPLLPVRASS